MSPDLATYFQQAKQQRCRQLTIAYMIIENQNSYACLKKWILPKRPNLLKIFEGVTGPDFFCEYLEKY